MQTKLTSLLESIDSCADMSAVKVKSWQTNNSSKVQIPENYFSTPVRYILCHISQNKAVIVLIRGGKVTKKHDDMSPTCDNCPVLRLGTQTLKLPTLVSVLSNSIQYSTFLCQTSFHAPPSVLASLPTHKQIKETIK